MLTYTYVSEGTFALMEKPKPVLQHERDAIVKVTLASICSSDLHIKHGSVPRAVPGITVGHEMVGIVEEVGSAVTNVKPGDRVTVNVETFCGECFFCKKGFVNNCTDQNGGWALGCRIDGGQAEYVRVPFADQGLNKIPDGVTDRQALLVGDVLATGFWAARISEITPEDTVLILGAGPTGICTLLCVMLHSPKRIIVCEKDASRLQFIRRHYPQVLTVQPEDCAAFVRANSDHGGADVVLEVAGADTTFRLAWECARPNAVVTVVALYDKAQTLPLPESDLCVLLSNALENALHACQRQNAAGLPAFIETSAYEQDGRFFLQLANACSTPVLFEDGVPVTREPGHGLGVRSICAIVEKYGGIYSFTQKQEQFILRISI